MSRSPSKWEYAWFIVCSLSIVAIVYLCTNHTIKEAFDTKYKILMLQEENARLQEQYESLSDLSLLEMQDLQNDWERKWATELDAAKKDAATQVAAEWNNAIGIDNCEFQKRYDTCIEKTPQIYGLFTDSLDVIKACYSVATELSKKARNTISPKCRKTE